jgi:hypothetical protein
MKDRIPLMMKSLQYYEDVAVGWIVGPGRASCKTLAPIPATYSGGFVVRLTSHQCPDRVRLEIQRKELSDAKPIRDSWLFPHSLDRGL